jgi:hypothetical protein
MGFKIGSKKLLPSPKSLVLIKNNDLIKITFIKFKVRSKF